MTLPKLTFGNPLRFFPHRTRLLWALLVMLAGSPCVFALETVPTDTRPNVVLILIDTLRADLLGAYGATSGASPELDALATAGVTFETAVAQCSWTRPSVGSMLTSRYPRSLGLYKESNEILNDQYETLAEILREEGYTTLGVTANPVINSVFNMHQGFDEYVNSDVIFSWMKPLVQPGDEIKLRRSRKLPSALDVFARAFELVSDHETGPFYIQLNVMEIHEAWRPRGTLTRPEYRKMFKGEPNKKYLRALRQVSSDIQIFIDQLSATPGFDNTLFIILSDHGQGMDSHPNVPLSSFHGRIIYGSQVFVPLIFFHNGGRLPPRRVETPVRLLDVLPTTLNYLNIEIPEGLDGRSLLPLIEGREEAFEAPQEFIVETFYRSYRKIAIFEPPWMYFENRNRHRGMNPFELQPWGIHENGKRTDRIKDFPDVAAMLKARLLEWESRHPIVAPTPNEITLSPAQIEQLESIGYLQD